MTFGQLLGYPLRWLIRAYQLVISPLLMQECRFYPSCSAYAMTAITRYGAFRGTWMAVRRLSRCHPWNPGGVDHVPPAGPDGRPMRDVRENGTDSAMTAPAGDEVPADPQGR